MTAQHVLAALGVLVCVALLVHQWIGARQQARLHLWWRGRVARARLAWTSLRHGWRQRHQTRQVKDQAEREAADLIERARRGAGRDDNVIRPGRFGDRRKDLH
ncbi:MAG: hypothetical protein JNM08_12700 [Rubrivivax sp.]|nr:hypothetical protein [Rubrivivax sp.]